MGYHCVAPAEVHQPEAFGKTQYEHFWTLIAPGEWIGGDSPILVLALGARLIKHNWPTMAQRAINAA